MRSQFQQWRLRLVSVAATIIAGLLIYRIVQVQIFRHDFYLQKAKGQWHEKVNLSARRGSIFDRNGCPLAVTHRSYSLGVTPKHFSKDDEAVEYLASVVGVPPKELKRKLSENRTYLQLCRDLHLSEDDAVRLSSLPGMRLDPSHDRLYPFEALPPQLIGAVNRDGMGANGVELAYQEMLAGEDGWVLANKDARDKAFHLFNAPGRRPKNGCDLYLTIDSRIQTIVDFELERALEKCSAARGIAIVVDPNTGDVLALSEKPSPNRSSGFFRNEDWMLRSASCIYEPGSTFKLITDSFLLETGSAGPFDVFYGEKGKAEFDFGVFTDDHEFGWMTLKESFVYSSNICTIKAMLGCNARDFYGYLLRFGFGGRTGVDLPAESAGFLRSPEEWSARSMPSISIGYEIGVTAFQMAMAYSALANGGILYAPRLVINMKDGSGNVKLSRPSVRVRRVLSEKNAETLKDFCFDVVRKGTGKKARVRGIPVGGKTGTSEKADGSGYRSDKHVTSFIGLAPLDKPRIVCLVVLDEPGFPYIWGAESAAPVFSNIVEGINLATDLLLGKERLDVAAGYRPSDKIGVPSFLRLTREEALDLAADYGLIISCSEDGDIVYSQDPDPETLVERGERVSLLLRKQEQDGGEVVIVPDLRGLSIREARRVLLASSLKCRIQGFGIVERQRPEAGRRIRCGGEVRLFCGLKSGSRANIDYARVNGGFD